MSVPRPTEDQIRPRAYDLYLRRGCQPGQDRDDWLQAEYELRQLPVRQLAELVPPRTKRGTGVRPSLIALVQAALVVGSGALPHLRPGG